MEWALSGASGKTAPVMTLAEIHARTPSSDPSRMVQSDSSNRNGDVTRMAETLHSAGRVQYYRSDRTHFWKQLGIDGMEVGSNISKN